MEKNYFIKLVLLLNLIFCTSIGYSQSPLCNGAEPVCGGGGFSYANSTGEPSIGSPDCLGSAPNPAWFYFQVSQSGPINIQLNQGNNAPNYNNQDVDFICWGPFASANVAANCNNLYDFPDGNTAIPDNVVACSYSAAATENFSIPGALAGQVYILLITNFSDDPGQIEFTQTNINNANAGLTDCELLLTLGPNITICQGQQAFLTTLVNGASDANAYAGATFTWTSTAPGFVPPVTNTGILTVTVAGTYTVTVTKPGFPANTSTSVVVSYPTPPPFALPVNMQQCSNLPNFDLTPNLAAIFNGTGLNPADFAITFHTSLADAEGLGNPIGNPTNYLIVGNPQTIYMGIEDNSANGGACIYTTSFTIGLITCQADPLTPPNLVLCDDPSNDGIEVFDFTPQTPIILGTNNPANYTITYHLSQANADNDVNPISPINNFSNTSNPQTIYIRMEEVANPLTFGTTFFQLIVNQYAFAGSNGSTTVCETSSAVINLFSLITGEQTGGVWVRNSGTGGTFDGVAGTFTPAVGATTSTFEYTVTATAPCTNSSSTATVNINPQPVAGTDGSTTICETSTATINLFSLITGEQAGGVWSQTSGSGGTFDPVLGTFTPAVGATSSVFTYTLIGVAPCTNDSSTATITINPQPIAGTDGSTIVCEGNTAVINLFSLITGEQAGGVWTRTSGTGGTFNAAAGTFTPSNGVITSTFAYTLTGIAPCTNASSTATVTINPLPTATIASNTPSVCLNYASPIVTFSGFTGVAPYDFVYTVNSGAPITVTSTGSIYDINVPTTTVGPITYCLVSVSDANGCSQAINQCVTVTVLTAPIINTPLPYALCDDESNDGVACFDLEGVVHPQVTTDNTLEVTFHETLTDAQTGDYDQASPYCNLNNLNNQIIYIRVFDPNAPECYAITTVELIVHPKPTAVEPTDLHECDNGDAQVGFTVFNLTDKASEILGGISPLTHTISYYESLADAQTPLNAIGNPTNYTNTVIHTQTIWVRVETTATGCFDIVELQLVVDPLPLVNQPACAAYTLCETTAPIGYEQFNLQTRVDCILQNQLGMSVTFYRSLADANNNFNPITNLLYTNQQQYVQTLGIRVTNTTTGCYVISTMDIRVEPLPIPVAPLTPYAVCDTDQNGLFEFDLNTLSAGILGANPTNNTISYHETQPDANNDNYPISLTQLYQNIIPYLQTIWVRVENPLTGCYGVIPIQLRVNESPRMPELDDLVYCDEDSNNQNAITTVNLAQQTPIILAAQTIPPTSNYTVTYYTSLANAQTQTSPIVNTTTYTGTNQTIWVVIRNNTTGCFEIGEFNLIVNIPLAITPPPALSVCDDDASPNDLHTTFDLTVRNDAITGGLPGYTVTYYPSYANALAGTNAITNPTAYINVPPAVQTLGVKVTSPEGCRSYTTMDIRVLPVPTPNTTNIPILAPQCEDALNSGHQFFDLTVNQTYILNGDPNVTPHYYHSLADATAVPPVNEITNPSLAYIGNPLSNPPRPVNEIQYIYIAVTSNLFTEYTGQNCAVIVRQPFIINPLPIANAIGEQQICEEDATGNDGYEVFNLPSYNNLILAGNDTTPVSTYVVNFYSDAGLTNLIANPSAYTNVTNPQTIYVSVTTTSTYVDPATGTTHTTSCTTLTNFDIRVNPKPTITQPAAPLATCDSNDGLNDGYQIYDLTSLATEILNGQDPTQFSVTFYESEYNPDATPPLTPTAIALPATHPVYTHTYWAAVTNNATGCFKTTSFTIVVEQMPEPFITNDIALNVICVDYTNQQVVRPLTLEVENQTDYLNDPTTPAPTYTYEWFEDGAALANSNSPSYTIENPLNDTISSIFTVVMTSQSTLGCSTVSQDYLVIQSGQATPIAGTIGYTVTNAFSDNQIITVTTEGYGTYQYSLDDGPRQDSPVFENVSLGEHFITVWDTEGGLENSCNPLILVNVQTIDYPLYFTPNGDGIHDSWNIVGLSGQPGARIYIFDRHGKLIKQLSSQSEGWNGTYNGQQMPATDYWFTVDYTEQNAEKQFRAHFSLKR